MVFVNPGPIIMEAEQVTLYVHEGLNVANNLPTAITTKNEEALTNLIPSIHNFLDSGGFIDGRTTHVTGIKLADGTVVDCKNKPKEAYRPHPFAIFGGKFKPKEVLLDASDIKPLCQAIVDEAKYNLKSYGNELQVNYPNGDQINVTEGDISQTIKQLSDNGVVVLDDEMMLDRNRRGYEIKLTPVSATSVEGQTGSPDTKG